MDMSKRTNLYHLGSIKESIVKLLSVDSILVSLLVPDYDPTTATQDLDIILKEHIYKTISIDNSQEDSKAYICMETYVSDIDGCYIKTIGVIVNVFCHESLVNLSTEENNKMVKLNFYGNRIDMLADSIDRIINGKSGLGIGTVRLRPRNPIGIYQPNNGYYGKSIEYVVSDFNNLPL